jgi:hypothetical protein
MTTEINSAEEFLDAMVNTLKTYGWVRWWFGNEVVGFCPLGAAQYVHQRVGNSLLASRVMERVRNVIVGRYEELSITVWNDDLVKDLDEVIDVLESAKGS